MFSVRVTPWHGLGAVLDWPPASVGEAIEVSGLGWSVAKEPVAIHRGGTPPDWARPASDAIPGYFATVRQDTREVFGIVGERYRIYLLSWVIRSCGVRDCVFPCGCWGLGSRCF
jgi:hypothetical protein